MTTPFKVASLAAGATATAGVGTLAFKGLSPSKEEKSISSLLSKDHTKRAIAVDESTAWTSAWASYKASSKDSWKLGNGQDVPEGFKNICRDKLESKVSGTDSRDYQDFLSYCARDTLISDLLKDSKLTPLSKTDADSSEGWKKAWEGYIEANKEKLNGDDAWKVKDFKTEKDKKDKALADFRDKCETHLGSKDISNTTLFDQVKSWCTKTSGQ
ncbi:hypothetical protein HF1_11500 [Mycoplasma haemofelis str. Langford 1]|uniref:Uncharacterized protein n=1 Tax=Mycoplasma haemofelis (strain Langford 1) TaxID=941640 RepID=E8ZJ37_MYCHL|nr:hypothetical protein [Mycoplasma haemofelis]CBY93158.1 hypothetical protein HF1_11500 [Mycoplasma haemofelis str. Langford 1]